MAKKCYVGVENFKPRTLPSGYTQIDYIESSGTQYIDTGFKPNQDTKFVIDCYFLESNTGTDHHIASVNNSSQYYALRAKSNLTGFAHRYYNNALADVASDTLYGRHTFVRDKNKTSIDGGKETTSTYGTFQITNTLPICCFQNESGAKSGFSKLRIYSCYIYDNEALVRDFVPCKNSAGVAGLYDLVNGVFYTDAAGGTFAAGTTHGYKARKVKKFYTGVANVTRKVKKGYVGVNNVARLFWSSGTPLGEFPVGEVVYLNENDVGIPYIIVNQGNPDTSVYDATANGTWLLRQNAQGSRYDGQTTYYSGSIHDTKCTSHLAKFDADVQAAIKTVGVPTITKYDTKQWCEYDPNRVMSKLLRKVFLLSTTELGATKYTDYGEGALLDYFTKDDNAKRKATDDSGTRVQYFTRTIRGAPTSNANAGDMSFITLDGGPNGDDLECWFRPVLVLPSETIFNPETKTFVEYSP